MKEKSESEVAQLCPTFSDPMDRSLPGSSILGIFQARVLERGAIAFSDILPRYSTNFLFFLRLYFLASSEVNIGEGDGTPLLYSCLENPMDGGAW